MIVSIFKSVDKVDVPYHRTIEQVFERIRNTPKINRELIQEIRKEKDKALRNELKKKLPGYCFGGKFQRRSKAGLEEPSGLAIFDIDGISKKKELLDLKQSISESEFVFSCFISPSGNGLKLLVKIPPSVETYKGYYSTFLNYLCTICPEQYLDKTTNDISRFCFESYDPDIHINNDSLLWDVLEEPEYEDFGNVDTALPLTSEHLIVEKLLMWFGKKYQMIPNYRNENLFKLAIAFSDFGVEQHTAEQIAIKNYLQKDFTESEIKTTISSAYRKGRATFKTKFFEDNDIKSRLEKLIKEGRSVDRISELMPNKSKREVQLIIEKTKEAIEVDKFWTYDKAGRPLLTPHKFKYWLQSNGFYKHYPTGSDVYTFIRKENNIIEETNAVKIKDFVMEWLLNHDEDGYLIYDYMARSSKWFTAEFLSMLDNESVRIKQDDKFNCYLYYSNGALNIKGTGATLIDYVDVDGFIWRKQMIDRKFTQSKKKGEFEQFVWLISGKEQERFDSLRSTLGFLCHSHTTSANNRAIILNDEVISENPNGGSGKSLLAASLGHVKKYTSINGKDFEHGEKFAYQTVSIDTQVLCFNDVKKNFNFENLFPVITEGITIEYKNAHAVQLPISQSPKIIITTNYTLGGVGGSHDRRKFEVELSGYFNEGHSPQDEFGRMMFDDWNADDWVAYDNFIVECIQFYLLNHLVKADFKNLFERKFIKETSYEFYEFASDTENITINTRIQRTTIFNEFVAEYPDFNKWLSQKRFSVWLDALAKFKGYKIHKGKTNGARWVEFETKDNVEPIMPF